MGKLGSMDVIAGDISVQAKIDAIALGTADEQEVAHHDGGENRKITAVSFIPDEAATGDATNNFKLALVNKDTDGSGTTEMAGLTFAAGVDLVEGDAKPITISATPANLIWKPGEVLAAVKTENASGLTMPKGVIQVTYQNVGTALL